MSATGIGASVRRKEDIRFITGKGQYTDDISRPGETRAVFVRSPHAHAQDQEASTPPQPSKMPGVVAVLTGAQLATDKIGNLICGWMIHSKDGSPMKMAAHPALASGKVSYVGDRGGGGDRRDAGAGEGRGREGEGRLRGAAGGDRSGQGAGQGRAADPRRLRRTTRSTSGTSASRRRPTDAFKQRQARHQARHHQQPPGAERDGAARRDRRIRCRQRQPSRCGTRRRTRTSRGS